MSAPTDRSSRRPRLLVVGPLPPPIGSVETLTQAILESAVFREFQLAHYDSTGARPTPTQRRIDLGSVRSALRHFGRLRAYVGRLQPDAVYLPVAGTWPG